MAEFTIAQQISAVEREIALRQNVYPRQVAQKKMSQYDAELHISQMRAVLKTLQWVEKNSPTIIRAVTEKTNGVHESSKADGASAGTGTAPEDVPGDGGARSGHA